MTMTEQLTEQLTDTADRVEGLRGNLGRVRMVLDQTDAVLSTADDLLGRTDEFLEQATVTLETSRRWFPRVAVVLGFVAVAGIATVVFIRMRRASREDY